MMDLHVKLALLLAICAAASTTDVSVYVPRLTPYTVPNKVTYSTFILEQPNCTFTQYSTTNVWLVVAKSEAVPRITDTDLTNPVPYSSFINKRSDFYHTLPLPAGQYPCANSLNFLLVGSEVNCASNQFCNGPLNNTFKYRVKFVLLSSTGIFDQTQWSNEIQLLQQKQVGDNGPKGRSGGMIVLTSILSVLLAILVIALIVALAIGSRDICWRRRLDYDVDEYGNVDYLSRTIYRTHYQHFNTPSFRIKRPFAQGM